MKSISWKRDGAGGAAFGGADKIKDRIMPKNTPETQAKDKLKAQGLSIGDILLKDGLISLEDLDEALKEQKKSGEKLGKILVARGTLSEEELARSIGKQIGIPYSELRETVPQETVLELLPRPLAQRYQVFPLKMEGSVLTLAMADPLDLAALEDLKFLTGKNINSLVATESAIQEAISRHYGAPMTPFQEAVEAIGETVEAPVKEKETDPSQVEQEAKAAPVIQLSFLILSEGIRREASDIHLEPYEHNFRVRYRIDGILYDMFTPPRKLKNALISRIKIMADMNIAEHRIPQDGRIKLRLKDGREMDFRVSSLPTMYGEKIVLRLLDKTGVKIDLVSLGFEPEPLALFLKALHKPYGMILVTGPTGSGKTTTLYAGLNELNQPGKNISTIEDPVEMPIYGVNQVQVREEVGLTFAATLRSLLRQDPDIIMVGEIRDLDTAEIAIRSALTGHLVLSTLHTNDAPSAVTRLLDMGIEPYLVSSSIHLVLAQRLVRRLCPHCRVEQTGVPQALERYFETRTEGLPTFGYKANGCPQCRLTGYRGRVGLYELMVMNEAIRGLIIHRTMASEIQAEAIRSGMETLFRQGVRKVQEGITSLEEVLSITEPGGEE
jgi:type IV pilus assembly protein PilB